MAEGENSRRWVDLYHYRIKYQDPAGETQTLILQTTDRLEPGSFVEDAGRLIQIEPGGEVPYRGVITPLRGRLR